MKQLLFSVTKKDFNIHTFASGGPGGQHQNTTNSGVRIVHRDSGAKGESREQRSQHQNKRLAFNRLCKSPKFQMWLKMEAARRMGQTEVEVDRSNRVVRNYKFTGSNKGVKDPVTGMKTGDIRGVLKGNIHPFIRARLLHQEG